ncbi:SPOR domain-containing protein [Inmirania thermothiophila]|uniref:Sporulation related protein n=1 Tax=Inmirania thermothiophila TaxID=1750597 RepID=A0A3N1YC65_9GAMM|nr:SPOR domain-containing protein [Inmirania thermothiophila]ROR34977.1 sporulation related protein [Inmirania thermothiophila]
MRALAALLALANLAFLVWWTGLPEAPSGEAPGLPAGAAPLVLLQEAPPRLDGPVPAVVAEAPAPDREAPDADGGRGRAVAEAAPPAPVEAAASDGGGAEPPAPSGAGAAGEGGAGGAASEPGAVAAAQPPPRLCVELGPFPGEAAARAAVTRLQGEGAATALVMREVALPPYHWVMVPPAPTEAEARRTLRALQARGVDSFIVTRGAHARAVSLGLFSRRETAEEVKRRVERLGHPVVIVPRERRGRRPFVQAEGPALEGLLAAGAPEGVPVRRIDCP